jgi:hypothetical protein
MPQGFYTFPLEKDDISRLRNGEHITKIFHNGIEVYPLFVVVIGKTKLPESHFHGVLANGDDATSIAVTIKEIDKIEDGDDVLRAKYKGFDIGFVSAEKMRAEGMLNVK